MAANRTPITADELSMLRAADTATVCNVIDLFDVRPRNTGFADRRLQCCYPDRPAMVGYAVTATVRTGATAPVGHAEFGTFFMKQLAALKASAQPPVVVFGDLDDVPVGAIFGEGMAAGYKAFGAVGVVTNGLGRDIPQIRDAGGVACFTTGTVASKAYTHIQELDVLVNICGLAVNPGDLLHGDANGLTVIPAEIAGRVARACKPFVDGEQKLFDYLRGGNVTLDGVAEARKRYAASVSELRSKL